jgi:predicted CoA-binding protein
MIFDMPCYSSLTEIPFRIDIVNVFRNSKYVFPIIKEAIDIKSKVIWLQDDIISIEGRKIAKNNNILYIENDCILRKHRSKNEL